MPSLLRYGLTKNLNREFCISLKGHQLVINIEIKLLIQVFLDAISLNVCLSVNDSWSESRSNVFIFKDPWFSNSNFPENPFTHVSAFLTNGN